MSKILSSQRSFLVQLENFQETLYLSSKQKIVNAQVEENNRSWRSKHSKKFGTNNS